jgi:hypothetical protein
MTYSGMVFRNFRFAWIAVIFGIFFIFNPASAVESPLSVSVEPGTVQAGNSFSVTIEGDPDTWWYIWAQDTGEMSGLPGDIPPLIADKQDGVELDNIAGPYEFGIYRFERGDEKTIKWDVADDPEYHGTRFYGEVTLDATGSRTVSWKTTKDTRPGKYIISVENMVSGKYVSSDGTVTVVTAASGTVKTTQPTPDITPSQSGTQRKILDYTTTSGLDDNLEPLDRKKEFSPDDTKVQFMVKMDGLNGGEQRETVFYDPAGVEFYRSPFTVPDPGEKGLDHWTNYVLSSYIYISGKKPATLPGKWTVKMYLDGKILATDEFTITPGEIVPKEQPAPVPVTPQKPVTPGYGTILTGPSEPVITGKLPTGGGTITVDNPGSPLNGMTIAAGPDCWPSGQKVSVSASPITSHSFGEYVSPVTPLITIDAGEGYSNEPVFVQIPVKTTKKQLSMAFYYDEATGKLEGIPTVAQDDRSITIATRHFSDIFISVIEIIALNNIHVVDSEFRPGVDDWEFINNGSVTSPNGICAGQSLTAMWYYVERKEGLKEPSLSDRYDNNGREKTPCCGNDNTLGYRFASVIHKIYDESVLNDFFNQINTREVNGHTEYGLLDNLTTFRLFKYSMLTTKEPQYVRIRGPGGSGGHALICYKVSGNNLSIADPNFPGDDKRTIELNGTILGPYSSGKNSRDISTHGLILYPYIMYMAKSSFVNWADIGDAYKKVLDGSIGDGVFPSYPVRFTVKNDDGTEESFSFEGGKNAGVKVFEVQGSTVSITSDSSSNQLSLWMNERDLIQNSAPIHLVPGDNRIGIEAFQNDNWMGYDWVNLKYGESPSTPVPPQDPPISADVCDVFDFTYDLMETVGIGGGKQYRFELHLIRPEESSYISYVPYVIKPGYSRGEKEKIQLGTFTSWDKNQFFTDFTEPGKYVVKVYKFGYNVKYDPWEDPEYPDISFDWNPCGIVTKSFSIP